MAPTPARTQGTTLPTAKKRDATATPTSPVAGSAAAIENVATRSGRACGTAPVPAVAAGTPPHVSASPRLEAVIPVRRVMCAPPGADHTAPWSERRLSCSRAGTSGEIDAAVVLLADGSQS